MMGWYDSKGKPRKCECEQKVYGYRSYLDEEEGTECRSRSHQLGKCKHDASIYTPKDNVYKCMRCEGVSIFFGVDTASTTTPMNLNPDTNALTGTAKGRRPKRRPRGRPRSI